MVQIMTNYKSNSPCTTTIKHIKLPKLISNLNQPSIIIFFILIMSTTSMIHACNRYRSYGEPCTSGNAYGTTGTIGYADTSIQCSPYKLLVCERMSGTCRCPDYYNHYWDTYQQRCFVKIGSRCKESYGGLSESWYNHWCPENSACNPTTGYCQCRPLFETTYDWLGCSSSKSIHGFWNNNILLGTLGGLIMFRRLSVI